MYKVTINYIDTNDNTNNAKIYRVDEHETREIIKNWQTISNDIILININIKPLKRYTIDR